MYFFGIFVLIAKFDCMMMSQMVFLSGVMHV